MLAGSAALGPPGHQISPVTVPGHQISPVTDAWRRLFSCILRDAAKSCQKTSNMEQNGAKWTSKDDLLLAGTPAQGPPGHQISLPKVDRRRLLFCVIRDAAKCCPKAYKMEPKWYQKPRLCRLRFHVAFFLVSACLFLRFHRRPTFDLTAI